MDALSTKHSLQCGCKCMNYPGSNRSQWEADAIASLRSLDLDHAPSLELLLLDALARWCFSDSNPGREYGEQHAAAVSTALLSAAELATSFHGLASPNPPAHTITAPTPSSACP